MHRTVVPGKQSRSRLPGFASRGVVDDVGKFMKILLAGITKVE